MIEAMACGTPVLAFEGGSVREVVDQGITGVVVNSLPEAIRMAPVVMALDRREVRRRFEQRFTAGRMAGQYVRFYEQLVARSGSSADVPLRVVPPMAVRA